MYQARWDTAWKEFSVEIFGTRISSCAGFGQLIPAAIGNAGGTGWHCLKRAGFKRNALSRTPWRGELPRHNLFVVTGCRNQLVCKGCRLARRKHPADHVANEHVEDDLEMKAGPFGRAFEFGDIPRPQLTRSLGQ